MNKRRNRKSSLRNILIAIAVALLMVAVVVFALGMKTGEPAVPHNTQPVSEQAALETPKATEAVEATEVTEAVEESTVAKPSIEMEEDGQLRITTQYAVLYYPADYAADVMIELSELQDGCRLGVFTNINGADLELYALTLSKTPSDGHQLGALNVESIGEVGFYLSMNEQNPADWSEDEYTRINELQETVNSLLMQVYEHEGFQTAQ